MSPIVTIKFKKSRMGHRLYWHTIEIYKDGILSLAYGGVSLREAVKQMIKL